MSSHDHKHWAAVQQQKEREEYENAQLNEMFSVAQKVLDDPNSKMITVAVAQQVMGKVGPDSRVAVIGASVGDRT
jgi:ABC-type enterochelin transport system substrate-binding protein